MFAGLPVFHKGTLLERECSRRPPFWNTRITASDCLNFLLVACCYQEGSLSRPIVNFLLVNCCYQGQAFLRHNLKYSVR